MKTTSVSTRFLRLVAALGLSLGVAVAQTSGVARADRKFIQEAAESGMFEVEIAQLAASKASSPDVKSLATTMANDHTNANNELVKLANSKKVEVPAAPPRGKRKDIEKLAKRTHACRQLAQVQSPGELS